MAEKKPIRVCISGAAGQIGYSLIPLVAGGQVFGHDQPLELRLLDIPPAMKLLGGTVMEIEDCAYPLLTGIVATADPKEAFDKIDAAILLGGFPRKQGMERKELLAKNSPIFKDQGKALNDFASKDVKVLVVANPANTNCLRAIKSAPDLPKENFSCMTFLDYNRLKYQVAHKLGAMVPDVKNVIVWGNHSKTMYPDVSHATVKGSQAPITDLLEKESKWVEGTLIPTVQTRGAAVIEARGFSSAMSAAHAAAEHMRVWWQGTREGEYVSMGIYSDGSHYGVAKDIVYSFPVTCKNKKFTVVDGLKCTEHGQAMMKKTEQELLDERAELMEGEH